MALTSNYSGTGVFNLLLALAYSGDAERGPAVRKLIETVFAAAGGTAPTISGWLNGTASLSGATNFLIAHATDPLQGAGDAGYSGTFAPAGAKVKGVLFRAPAANTQNVTIAAGAADGFALTDTAGAGIVLQPGGWFYLETPAGSAALATGTNDKLTATPVSGTQALEVTIIYGP